MECTQRCSTAPGHRLPNVLASTAWALHMLLQTPPVVRVCGDTARVPAQVPPHCPVHCMCWHLGRHSLSGTGPHGSVWGPLGVRAWGRPRHLPLHSPPPPPPTLAPRLPPQHQQVRALRTGSPACPFVRTRRACTSSPGGTPGGAGCGTCSTSVVCPRTPRAETWGFGSTQRRSRCLQAHTL